MKKKLYGVLVAILAMNLVGCVAETQEESKENAQIVAEGFMTAYTSCDKAAMAEYVAEGISTEEFAKTYEWMDTCVKYDATMSYKIGEIILYTGEYLEEFCSKSGVPESKVDRVAAVYVDIVTVQAGQTLERNAYLYIGLVDGDWLAVYPDNL